jgi:hypothetical protein
MGPQAMLAIEPLGSGEPTWRVERGISIVRRKKEESRFGPGFHRPIPRPPFARGSSEPKEKIESITPAFERYVYELGRIDGDMVQIKKRYELETLDGSDDLKVTGSGTILFNKREGVPESMTFEATFTLNEGNFSATVPITFSYHRVQGDAACESKATVSNPLPPSEERLREPDKYELDDLLEQLRDGGDVRKTLGKLRGIRPGERRKEVALEVAKCLENKSLFVRQEAAWTLQVWYVEENVPDLLEVLEDSHFPVRHSAIWMLSHFPRPEIAGAIVKVYGPNEIQAKPSLIRMGPVAEDAVLTLLEHKDWPIRKSAGDILSRIGTEKSLPKLKERAKEKTLAGSAAKGAIDAIKLRIRAADEP